MQQYFKVARTDGFDFYTGNTINYRDNIGKTVINPKQTKSKDLCSSDVLHASKLFFDALSYGQLPCSIFIVEGKSISKQSDKDGFKKLKIIKEISTIHWKESYYKFMIWMLEDLKNNFDTKKEINVVNVINQTINVFINAQKTGKIDKSAAEAAARSAERSAWTVAEVARSVARSAAWSVEAAAESAAKSVAKEKELSNKFIEYLQE